MRRPLLFIVLFALSQALVANTYQDALTALNTNKTEDALRLFRQSLTSKENVKNAKLGEMFTLWCLGRDGEAFKSFSEFYTEKVDPNPYPTIYALWSMPFGFASSSNMADIKVDFLEKLIADPKTPGTLKAMAHHTLGLNDQSIQKFKDANKEFNQIGSIDNWQLLGEFDNIVGSGFDKDFGALAHPEADHVFKNKANADVRWFTPPASKSDKWYYFDYYFIADNSIMYAQSFVQSETDQEVVLRSGCSGSLKIWVNDALIVNESKERNCDMDIYNQKIKLNKGYNRILVQIGESEVGRANFLIRLTDEDGNPVNGITATDQLQAYKKAAGYTSQPFKLFAETYFENEIAKQPNDFFTRLLYAETLMRNDKTYEARKSFKLLKDQEPKSTMISHRMIEAYSRDNNQTDLTKEQEFVKKNDPTSILSHQLNINSFIQKEDYDGYERELNKLTERYGTSSYTEPLKLSLLAYRKDITGLYKMAEELYEKYPESYVYMNLQYAIVMEKTKNLGKGNQLLESFLKKHYNAEAELKLISNLFKLGESSKAISLYNKRLENFPYAVGYFSQLSDIYFSLQQYKNALDYVETTLKFAPYIGKYHNDKAQILEAMNKKDEAATCYTNAIKYSPTDYESRKLLRKLNGKKELFENFSQEDIYELFKKSPEASTYPNDNCVVLLNDEQEVIYPEGASEKKVRLAVKVFNQSGVDNWKQYQVYYNSYTQRIILDKAEVLKKDGSKLQAENDNNTFVFTNLEPGDAIYISYKIQNYTAGRLAQHFWGQFNFQYSVPSLINRYRLLVPEEKKFKYEVMNGNVTFKQETFENYKLYSWEALDQKAIKNEPFNLNLCDIAPTLDFSSIPDWNYVSTWYSDLSSNKAKQDFELKEAVENLFKSSTAKTPLEKAQKIHDFIVSTISYSNVPFLHGPLVPQTASRTLATKQGDCKDVATLFVAMCKEVKLDASLVLVDSKSNGKKNLNLPSTNFDHCIAKFNDGTKSYFVELTDPYLSFNALPASNINANCLLIPGKEENVKIEGLTPLINPQTIRPGVKRITAITFDNKDMNVNRTNIRFGSEASITRAANIDLSKEDQEKSLSESISSDFTTPVKITASNFGDLTKLTDTVVTSYAYNVKKALTDIAGLKIFSMPWGDKFDNVNFTTLETREYPFSFWELQRTEVEYEQITVTLPTGSVLVEMPKDVQLSCPVGEYSIKYEKGKLPNEFVATRTFKRTKDVLDASDYQKFKQFFSELAESDVLKIAIK
jgi:tetratricopeptide (TPR) repeat protein